jgi:hypothetical protein
VLTATFDVLPLDRVTGDDIAGHRLAAAAGMDVDPGRSRRRVIGNILSVVGDIVASDQVAGELPPGLMDVHRNSRLAIADYAVADDHVVVGRRLHRCESRRAGRGEKPNAGAVSGDEEPVLRSLVVDDRITEDAVSQAGGGAIPKASRGPVRGQGAKDSGFLWCRRKDQFKDGFVRHLR